MASSPAPAKTRCRMNDPENHPSPVVFSVLNSEGCPLPPPSPALDVISMSVLNGRICGPCEQRSRVFHAARKENVPARLTLQKSHDPATVSDQENSEG